MFIDIKFVIVFNRIGHDKDIFFGGGGLCRRCRSFGWFSLVYVGALMGQYVTGSYLNKSYVFRVRWVSRGLLMDLQMPQQFLSVVVVPTRFDVHGAWAFLALYTTDDVITIQ